MSKLQIGSKEMTVNGYNFLIQRMFTTVVSPEEYDLDTDMLNAMKLSIKEKSQYILMDIGKMVGLWQAFRELEIKK